VAAPNPQTYADIPLPRSYGRGSLRIFMALIETLGPPRDLFDVPSKEPVLRSVLSFIPFLPAPLRYGLPFALWAFERAPWFFGFGARRFSNLSAEEAERYMLRWEHGRPPLTQVYAAFHALVLASFYQQPEVLAALQVDWHGRAEELIARRARLMTMSPELANPRNAGARRKVG